MKSKILFLLFCIFISYMFTYQSYIYIKFPLYFAETKQYSYVFTTDHTHLLGFAILGYVFGFPIILLAVLDEVLQALFIKSRVFDFKDILFNFLGAGLGIGLRKIVFFRNPFKRRFHA